MVLTLKAVAGGELQIPPLRSPGFPVETRGFEDLRALSLRRAAYEAVANSAKWEIRVRSGRMTRGEGRLTLKSAIGIEAKCRSLGSDPKEQIPLSVMYAVAELEGRDLTIPPVDWWRG